MATSAKRAFKGLQEHRVRKVQTDLEGLLGTSATMANVASVDPLAHKGRADLLVRLDPTETAVIQVAKGSMASLGRSARRDSLETSGPMDPMEVRVS